MRILLVEDDVMLGDTLQRALIAQQYAVDWVKTGEAARHTLLSEHFDLVIMDLGLPGMDGIAVLQHIRRQGKTLPVLILTARDSVADRVQGLDSGADDYLLKPFDLFELFARLRALLRRGSVQHESISHYGDISLNSVTHEVSYKKLPVELSRREYMLLEIFLNRPGQVFTRQQLEQSIYGWGDEVGSNALEVHIHHLRKKISNDLIKTVRGVGYVLQLPGERL